jgi:hypothetical protein
LWLFKYIANPIIVYLLLHFWNSSTTTTRVSAKWHPLRERIVRSSRRVFDGVPEDAGHVRREVGKERIDLAKHLFLALPIGSGYPELSFFGRLLMSAPLEPRNLQEPSRTSIRDAGRRRDRMQPFDSPTVQIAIASADRLHADDLVAHLQENGQWEVLSFPAKAERTLCGAAVLRHARTMPEPKLAEEDVPAMASKIHQITRRDCGNNPTPPAAAAAPSRRHWRVQRSQSRRRESPWQ